MASITVQISDSDLPKIVDAICALHGYDDLVDPPTKGEFARGYVVAFLEGKVRTHENNLQREQLQQQLSDLEDIDFGEE